VTTMNSRRLQIAGWTINAMHAGHGRPILFLHGLGMSWEWWRPTMEVMADDYSVCAVDLPGWGGSSAMSAAPNSPEAYRDLVAGIIQSIALGPTVVVGHSLGGYIAVRAAVEGTPQIKALALVAPGGFGQVHNLVLRLLSFPGLGELMIRTGDFGFRIFVKSTVDDPASISADLLKAASVSIDDRKEFVRQLRLGMRLGRTTDAYLVPAPVALTVPVLLMWGLHDRVLPLEIAHQAQRALSAEQLVIFEHSGHLPQLEEPARFNTELRSFCSRLWSS
jgi:pimeloyl-ACP methyl ester carboxylesterase